MNAIRERAALSASIWHTETTDFGGYSARDADAVANKLWGEGYRKPRVVNTIEELDALPVGSLIRALLHEKQCPGMVLEKIGKNWLALDPSDRYDGEDAWAASVVLRVYNAGIFVLFTPDGQ